MSDNNSLNKKYQKFESEEEVKTDEIEENTSLKKEKKKKEPKEKKSKEKKAKEPKPPKEKKPKEPKEKKVKEPKEKKVKPPKEPKIKKNSHKKDAENNISAQENDGNSKINEKFVRAYEEALLSNEADEKKQSDNISEKTEAPVKNGRQKEEIVFEGGFSQSENTEKNKRINGKKEKAPKEKKAKEPKEKKIKEKKPKKEKKKREPLQKKDIVTIALSVVALILVICTGFFAYFNSRTDERKIEIVSKVSFLGKIFPQYVVNPEDPGTSDEKYKLSNIQIAREGVFVNLVQTDFPGVFYGINTDYTVQYYQYNNSRVVPVKYTDTVDLKVDMGSDVLNVKMNYIKSGEYVSGISVFTAEGNNDVNYFYNFVVFKLTVLPQKYQKDGHALLLASTDKSALEGNSVLWTESFDVNLNDGSVTRFLSVVNRNIDEKGAGVADFCILNKAGYTATTQGIPFITSREYPTGSGMQDIFVKNGNKETLLASNIYGKYFTADETTVAYLRKTETGFDVVHNTGGNEKVQRSFYGFMGTAYSTNDKYILSKEDGRLYNILSGKDYSLVGYSMDVSSFTVSSDDRYVVMMGTVKNAVDYQIHIFDLQTGEYAKFQDKNYAPHGTLCFMDNKTVLYTAVEPNKGYEYVALDIEKAFNFNK